MKVDKKVLTAMGISDANATRYLPDLQKLLPQHSIDTPLRVAHFLAQVAHESGMFSVVEENLNYSAKRLREIFPKRFTESQAAQFAGRKEAIGNRAYANKNGNGDEDSGDGFRYRGRGLIQTTGKANYRELNSVVGTDVVASPDLVASRFPVHGAVSYWSSRKLNALADVDDVKAVTLKVNGGLHGLADRTALLTRAKAALPTDGAAPALTGATHVVKATQLNLRREPRVAPATLIAALPQGTPVAVLGNAEVTGWVRIRTVLSNRLVEGVVKAEHLQKSAPVPRSAPPSLAATGAASHPAAAAAVPPAHLAEGRKNITRALDGGRAFPLGEPNMPRRDAARPDARARQLLEIVRFLDSEKKSHARYGPKSSATYCNIYAYDYCYLAQVYLPRVFWTRPALQRLAAGEKLRALYDNTVRELNANSLQDWLQDFGAGFGWQRVLDLDALQAAANAGEVCLITAKRKDLNRSGHIVAVVPEHGSFTAARGADGGVVRPVESQAGATNHRFVVKSTAWWRGSQFQSFAFWRHA